MTVSRNTLQYLVPNVPNKIYFQVKSLNPDCGEEAFSFAKADLVKLTSDEATQPETLITNINEVHKGMSSFSFIPEYQMNTDIKYFLRIYRHKVQSDTAPGSNGQKAASEDPKVQNRQEIDLQKD